MLKDKNLVSIRGGTVGVSRWKNVLVAVKRRRCGGEEEDE